MRNPPAAQTFTTSTGKTLKIGRERFQVPEVFLQPFLLEMDSAPVQEAIYTSIMRCDVDLRPELYENIIMVGSNVKFKGLAERIRKEITTFAPRTVRINVTVSPDPENAVWRGGDKLAPLLNQHGMWITKDEYAQEGAIIVHRKCF